ncbi:unnamed protein product [Miscanthus lutarioriparius]|uniref:Sulfotransferase n=1 Tax=Miscanthus lutarioriparius TaxID=422564 RepID=A0A811NVI2_9POAL|nr:unnamed protein product [Miscanthus lutarioriparius]
MDSRQPENDAQEDATLVMTPHADVVGIIPSAPPLETRWPPFALCRYAGGFWLPEFKALAFATLKRSTHPPSDGDHPLRHRSPHECVRFLEIELNDRNKDEFEALPSPRVLATHLPYSLLPGSITEDGERLGCRIVYVCREPKDALVSYWLFTRKAAAVRGLDVRSFTIQEALELFCDGRCPGGPQWLHVLQYWEESLRRPERVLFLRYEEMLLEPEAHVRKLAKFMG